MKKQIKIDREHELKEFGVIAANWINANALVNDNWINSLKTYYNVTITKEEMGMIWMLIMCMYIELTLARLEDVLEPRELVLFEKAIIEHIAQIESILGAKTEEEDKRKDIRRTFENSFYSLLDIYRTNRKQQNITIPQNYLAYMTYGSYGPKLTDEIRSEYINAHVQYFEERDFRTQLSSRLSSTGF